MKLDRRDCPDWMHIRQWIYLENTSPRTLSAAVAPYIREHKQGDTITVDPDDKRPAHIQRRRLVDPAGMITQSFKQKFDRGSKCSLCNVDTLKGERVAYWGTDNAYGHALCRVAQWSAHYDATETKRLDNAAHARARRAKRKK